MKKIFVEKYKIQILNNTQIQIKSQQLESFIIHFNKMNNTKNIIQNVRIPITLTSHGRAIGTGVQGTSSGAMLLQKTLSQQKKLQPSRSYGYQTQVQNHNTASQDQAAQPSKPTKADLDRFQNKNKAVLRHTGEFGEYAKPGWEGFGHPTKLLQGKLVQAQHEQIQDVPLAEKKAQVQIGVTKPRTRSAITTTAELQKKLKPTTARKQKTNILLELMNKRNQVPGPPKHTDQEMVTQFESHLKKPPRSIIYSVNTSQGLLVQKHRASESMVVKGEMVVKDEEEAEQLVGQEHVITDRDQANEEELGSALGLVPTDERIKIDIQDQQADEQPKRRPMGVWNALVPIIKNVERTASPGVGLTIEDGNDKIRFHQEIKELQKHVTYAHKKKKKTKSQRLSSPDQASQADQDANEGNEADNEAAGPAFMTQPQAGAHEGLDSALRIDPKHKGTGIAKSKSTMQQEKKVRRCLDYLGIKDKYMLDHFEPNFQQALEQKTKERLAEQKALLPSYEAQSLFEAPKEEPQRHFYIEKYPSQSNSHATAARRMVPMSRALAKVGSDGALVKVEQTQYPAHPNERPKRLKVCKFNDQELQTMCSKAFKNEKEEWKLIQRIKDERRGPYIEPVYTAKFEKQVYETQIEKVETKMKQHHVNNKLMQALEQARKLKGLDPSEDELMDESAFDPEAFIDEQFRGFSVNDLRDHQQTILNVFHQYMSTQGLEDKDATQTDSLETDKRFTELKKLLPSFKERLAFVNSLKKRWREQNGYCSVFDRIRAQKLQKEKNELKITTRKGRKRMQRLVRAGKLDGNEIILKNRAYDSDNQVNTDLFNQIYLQQGDANQEDVNRRNLAARAEYGDISQNQYQQLIREMRQIDPMLSITSNENARPRSASNRNRDIDPGTGSIQQQDNKDEPLSQKSLREWGSHMGHTQSQGARVNVNQKYMSAVYKHTKRDMESLEKYMSNIQVESLEKDQLSTDGVVNHKLMTREGGVLGSERLKDQNTLESHAEPLRPSQKENTQKNRSSNLSSLRLSPSAKQELIDRQNEVIYRKSKELERSFAQQESLAALNEHPIPAGGLRAHLDTGKEKIIVDLKDTEINSLKKNRIRSLGPGQQKSVATQPPMRNVEFAQHPILQRDVSPDVKAKLENPAVIFQPNKSMPMKPYVQAHARRHKNIKSMVQLQLRGGRQYGRQPRGKGAQAPEEKSKSPADLNQAVERTLVHRADLKSAHSASGGAQQAPHKGHDKWLLAQPGFATQQLHHQAYLDNMNKTFYQYQQQIQQESEEQMGESAHTGKKPPQKPKQQVLLLMGQQCGKNSDLPRIPGGRAGKRPKTGQAQREDQGGQTHSRLYRDEVDLLDGQAHEPKQRDPVKIKHQIDLSKNMQINHEESLRAFNSQPSPGKKTPIQIKREAVTGKHSTEAGLSQESQVIQSTTYHERPALAQRSQNNMSGLQYIDSAERLQDPENIALDKYQSSDYRRQVRVGNAYGQNDPGNKSTNLVTDPNKPVLSEDSQGSQVRISKDFPEMPKMLGVTTYAKDEAWRQVPLPAGQREALQLLRNSAAAGDEAAVLALASMPPELLIKDHQARLQEEQEQFALAGGQFYPTANSLGGTGPVLRPDFKVQYVHVTQLPLHGAPPASSSKSLPRIAPTASVHVNVPHQQFTDYQKSLSRLSPGQQHQRQRMNQLMAQNSFQQQAQQKGGISITGQALRGVAMSPSQIQQMLKTRQATSQGVDADITGEIHQGPLLRRPAADNRGYMVAVNTEIQTKQSVDVTTSQQDGGSVMLNYPGSTSLLNTEHQNPTCTQSRPAPISQSTKTDIKVMVQDEIERNRSQGQEEGKKATTTIHAADDAAESLGQKKAKAMAEHNTLEATDAQVTDKTRFVEQRIEDHD